MVAILINWNSDNLFPPQQTGIHQLITAIKLIKPCKKIG